VDPDRGARTRDPAGDPPARALFQRWDRVTRVVPFVVSVGAAVALAALPPGPPNRLPLLAVATAGFALCGTLIVALRWERPVIWSRLAVVVLFCASVGVVREATGGAASGYASLLLLVVVWQGAYGDRREMVATIGLVATTVAVPIVALGAPTYPATEWRKVLLLTLMSTIIGGVIQQLVRDVRRERRLIHSIGALARSTMRGDDPRHLICEATRELAGADLVVMLEPAGDGLRVTGSSGVALPRVVIPPGAVTPHLRAAVATLEAQVVLDTARDPRAATGASESLGMRAWMHQPAARHGAAAVVLSVGWCQPRRRALPASVRVSLPLLATEAAAAIERAEMVEQLAALARQDPLTGLMNRRAWDDHLAREVARAGRTGRPLTVAVLDLDHFKAYNDEHGHLAGDQLLKAVAGRWTGALRTSDVLARWGGEEFAVLMLDTAADEARRVLARVAERTPMGQTFSAGFVTTTEAHDPDLLMAGADAAVYAAKAAGRDRAVQGSVGPATDPVARPAGAGEAVALDPVQAPAGGTSV